MACISELKKKLSSMEDALTRIFSNFRENLLGTSPREIPNLLVTTFYFIFLNVFCVTIKNRGSWNVGNYLILFMFFISSITADILACISNVDASRRCTSTHSTVLSAILGFHRLSCNQNKYAPGHILPLAASSCLFTSYENTRYRV